MSKQKDKTCVPVVPQATEEQNEKNACWSATEGKIPNNNSSYVVEGITTSDSPVEFISFDELTHDPSNRLGEIA